MFVLCKRVMVIGISGMLKVKFPCQTQHTQLQTHIYSHTFTLICLQKHTCTHTVSTNTEYTVLYSCTNAHTDTVKKSN